VKEEFLWGRLQPAADFSPPLDFGRSRVAGNLACRRPFRPPSLYATTFSGFAARSMRDAKPKKIRANCVPELSSFDGGLKGRLQARLPATQPSEGA
jgi:hypothetical protein